jgi:hypothetical protein
LAGVHRSNIVFCCKAKVTTDPKEKGVFLVGTEQKTIEKF